MSQTMRNGGVVELVSGPPAITLDKVNKWYGAMHVLRDVSLTVAEKERVVVCGPSGSGKSTMIRCINRLETHQEGRIVVDGTELTDDLRALDTIRREVGRPWSLASMICDAAQMSTSASQMVAMPCSCVPSTRRDTPLV